MDKLKFTIDGREAVGFAGQTILEAARDNGIKIPTLCHDERVKAYGACGLCVVEVEGEPRLLRACASQIAAGMTIHTDNKRVRDMRRLTLELLLSDHTGDCRPPCVVACPAHTDCQGYVGLIANGRHQEAAALIKEKLPLPASIGRICPHPCEDACRRQLVEEPVAIAALKAFAGDFDLADGEPWMPEIKPDTGKKVAIVGSGPAGLTAAYFLVQAGHAVTVYEAMPQPGGMLRYGIPEYRLPKKILDAEIDLIRRMGVDMVTGTRIGQDISLEQLISDHDAVFVGIGAWESWELGCPGDHLPGVMGGIEFLREVSLKGRAEIGERVAVVGGGNTAMDAARTALRLGAQQVMVLYRRTRREMPAEDLEIQEAQEEGIEFRFLVAPLEVIGPKGKVESIHLQKMELGEPDESGRRRPVPISGAEEVVPVDTIISAIGQQVRPDGLEAVGLTRKGTIATGSGSLATDIPGVFAGGDAVTGPGIAIEAIAQGQQAAREMNDYLEGRSLTYRETFLVQQPDLTAADFAHHQRVERTPLICRVPEERCQDFREVSPGYREDEAMAEALRCLECGCQAYFDCRLLAYANQYDVVPGRLQGARHQEELLRYEHLFIQRDANKCILCGLCVRICDEVMGVGALGLVERGFDTTVKPEFGLPLYDMECISCGQCVAVCPTGALGEKYPLVRNFPMDMNRIPSVCSFCDLGCEQVVEGRGGLVARIRPVSQGLLCYQGRFGFADWNQERRLLTPLVKKEGELVAVSWGEALGFTAARFQEIKSQYGESSLAVLVSPGATMEEVQAVVGWAREGLGINNLASFTPNPVRRLQEIGLTTGSCRLSDLEHAELIVMVGGFDASQITAVRVRRAVKSGARLVLVNKGPTLVDDLADLRIDPADSTGFWREVLSAYVQPGLTDGRLEEEEVGIWAAVEPGPEAQQVADLYGRSHQVVIVVDGSTTASSVVEILSKLARFKSEDGQDGSGLLVVNQGGNAMGLVEAGILHGYEDYRELLQQGKIKGMLIVGEDPVGTGRLKPEELRGVEFLVVLTPIKTATSGIAHVVLPGSTPLETDGVYRSCDGQLRRLNRVRPPAAGMDNREIIAALAAAMKTV